MQRFDHKIGLKEKRQFLTYICQKSQKFVIKITSTPDSKGAEAITRRVANWYFQSSGIENFRLVLKPKNGWNCTL
jgi:hypothetical protein